MIRQEANQLAINFYMCGRGEEHGTAVNKSSQQLGWGLKLGVPDYNSSTLTAQPRSFLPALVAKGKFLLVKF